MTKSLSPRGVEKQTRKEFRLSPADWDMIARRMRAKGQKNFSKFARELLTTGVISVSYQRTLSDSLERHLSAIGNNINQIARQANTNNMATHEMVNEAYALLTEIHRAVSNLGDNNGSSGDRRSDNGDA
ncbi:MobC family plasmid mobilization relaxosome protein [Arcanobacterium bovis]|uniref:MobC family plasmid mobilization relaxosome protein n=1 Tax=Arcanobacterium bovis TaxID=2529275 RepID=A0A4Q9UYM1_9ACTO|nr:MobC family plasmid mobilization relaxosome protein [Arcanobacterium bovis]TBW20768.1 MobC family plasmid mobilization relaxosome protein [Arcanobacterium bovis]